MIYLEYVPQRDKTGTYSECGTSSDWIIDKDGSKDNHSAIRKRDAREV